MSNSSPKSSNNNIIIFIVVILISIAVMGALFIHVRNNDVTKHVYFGNIQYVFEKRTVDSVSGPNNYADRATYHYYLKNSAGTVERLFYKFTDNAFNINASFDGSQLNVSTQDSVNGSINRIKHVDLSGAVVGETTENILLPEATITSPDGKYTAQANYANNPQPVADGMPLVSFVNTTVKDTTTDKVVATYISKDFAGHGAIVPETFTPDNKSIILNDRNERPQEIGSPETWYIQEIGGAKKKLFDNPVTSADGSQFAFTSVKMYPAQNIMLGFKRNMSQGSYTSGDTITTYDFTGGKFTDSGIVTDFSNFYPQNNSTRVYYLTSDKKVGEYDIISHTNTILTSPISAATYPEILQISADGNVLAFSTTDKETRTNVNSTPAINGESTDVNVTKTYLYDISRDISKLIFTSEKPIFREYVGDSYYTFLGFVK